MTTMFRETRLSFSEWLKASVNFVLAVPRLLAGNWKFAVNNTFQERRKPKCPRCAKRLATDKAQQCFGCGLRWHGSPKPDARSAEFANWPREKYDSFFGELIRQMRSITRSDIRRHWDLCAWQVLRARWREADAWAAAGVNADDVRALKELIASQRFKHPIIGIDRISKHRLEINVGWLGHPLMGSGTILVVRREKNGWRIEAKSHWVS
jgi:hypothetical protein